ncbi:MAG: hypothetical protein AAFU85_02270 [Planctomycetota bacterium]
MIKNPYQPTRSAESSEASPFGKTRVRCLATGIPFAGYCIWQWLQMTPNTSFEHHPYSGALILIHEARTAIQLVVCSVICLAMIGGIFAVVIRPNALTALLSASSLFAWFYLSHTFAVWASI